MCYQFFRKKVHYLPPAHASTTKSRNIIGRKPSIVIPLLANQGLMPTMSAKSLGTFPVICAIDEVQNPLPLKTMLFKRHMTSLIRISDTFPNS